MGTVSDTTATDRLLQRVQQGDDAALQQLTALYRPYLRRLIDLRMENELRKRVDPSDVVQETQLVASQRIDDFLHRRPTSYRLWLRRKALEQLVDARRRHVLAAKRSVRREVTLSDASSLAVARKLLDGGVSKLLQRKELAQLLRDTLENLRELDREVLLLRHVEDLSNAETAEVLGVDPATASRRYGRALRRLYAKLVESGYLSH